MMIDGSAPDRQDQDQEQDYVGENTCRISTTAGTSYIKCPYFLAHGRTQVRCRGFEEGSCIIMRFKDAEMLRKQERIFCKGRYYNCQICQAIDAYEED